jgi:capsular polysaccharide transport system permease protein
VKQAIPTRTPVEVTLAVWKALFMREAVKRLSAGRAAWLWLLIQPLVHVTWIMLLYSTIRKRSVPGADAALFIGVGVLAFLMFRKPVNSSLGAIKANAALFSYRQVHPVDTVLVRCMLEGILQAVCSFILLTMAAGFGLDVFPHNLLAVLLSFSLLWLLGVGLGLTLSVGGHLIPEIDRIMGIIFMPLYLLSGVMYPLSMIPPGLREILMLNPIVHGIEYMRSAFFPGYTLVAGVDITYLTAWVITLLFLGLALHVRFERRLAFK